MTIREFLADIADNEIIPGKKYAHRIELKDGGVNSYIGIDVDVDDWAHKPRMVTRSVRVYRHTNSVDNLTNSWLFSLGDVCHPYADEPSVPLRFEAYGKMPNDAEAEAKTYFKELRRFIRKATSDYKIEAAETAAKEREALLARLSELDATL